MSHFHPVAVLALALAAAPLRAAPAVVVSLANVGDRVRAQNPDLAAARLRVREALGRLHQSGRLANPELETAAEHNPGFREGKIEIGVSQRFPAGGRLRLEKDVSLTELKSAEAGVREAERQLTGQARAAVVKILAARQQRALLRQQAGAAADFAGSLAEISARGEGSPLDAGQAKLEAATFALEMRQLDAAEMALAGELKPLLGMRPGEALDIGGKLPPAALPGAAADPARRPDFQAARLDALAAAQGVTLEKARRREDLEGGIFAGAERTEDAPRGYENEAIVGVRFKIPLPLWNKNEGAIEAAEAMRRRKELEATALGRTILLEAEAARGEMRGWLDTIGEIDGTLLPLAEEQATFAETAYRGGQGEIQSVLRAREKRLQLAAARLDALREFHLARVRLETALGNF